jgi:RNA polymerase sigma-70 factor (ECF subfamily)
MPLDISLPPASNLIQGDDAQASLYHTYKRSVAYQLSRRVRSASPADIEDLTQDVFVKVFASLPSFKGESRFSTWLHTIVASVATDHLRKLDGRETLSYDAFDGPEHLLVDTDSPEQLALDREKMRELINCLRVLPPLQAEVLVRRLAGECHEDISALLNCNSRALAWWARRSLAKAFEGVYDEPTYT